jgi:hypothetical protein
MVPEDQSFRRHGNHIRGRVNADEELEWPPSGEFDPLPLPVLPPVEVRVLAELARTAENAEKPLPD